MAFEYLQSGLNVFWLARLVGNEYFIFSTEWIILGQNLLEGGFTSAVK